MFTYMRIHSLADPGATNMRAHSLAGLGSNDPGHPLGLRRRHTVEVFVTSHSMASLKTCDLIGF